MIHITIVNGDTTYEVLDSFNHVYTKEKRYKVKRIYSSGGLDYITVNDQELDKLKEGLQV